MAQRRSKDNFETMAECVEDAARDIQASGYEGTVWVHADGCNPLDEDGDFDEELCTCDPTAIPVELAKPKEHL